MRYVYDYVTSKRSQALIEECGIRSYSCTSRDICARDNCARDICARDICARDICT